MKKAGGSKLFDRSEDEDDGTEEDRFKIKPQFEGRAGQKVSRINIQMILCSCSYGTLAHMSVTLLAHGVAVQIWS